LIACGLSPLVLDAGERLEPERQALVDTLADLPLPWPGDTVAQLTDNPTLSGKGIPRKVLFGSEFLYGWDRPHSPLTTNESFVAPTFAYGGYSIAWGAAMLPIHKDEMADWPISRHALEASYARTIEAMPYSAADDALSSAFPLFRMPTGTLQLSTQDEGVLSDLGRVMGVMVGRARLGVYASGDSDQRNEGRMCIYCGHCLSGCPRGSIHTFDRDFTALIKQNRIEYRAPVIVRKLSDTSRGITIHAVDEIGRALETLQVDKLFLAAGTINSTRIILESLEAYGIQIFLKDSQKFLLPIVTRHSLDRAWPEVNALPSLFLEIPPQPWLPNWAHAQVSPLNRYVTKRFEGLVGKLGGWRWRLARPFLGRMIFAWCGLHSDLSGGFSLSLHKGVNGAPSGLALAPESFEHSHRVARKLAYWLMMRMAPRFGVLAPAMLVGNPGAGWHFGGTLPMRAWPSHSLETDILGRPAGWQDLHIVDGSVLPAIPATTLAWTIMANADRITREVMANN